MIIKILIARNYFLSIQNRKSRQRCLKRAKKKRIIIYNNKRFIIKPDNFRDKIILINITQDKANFIYVVIYIFDDFV